MEASTPAHASFLRWTSDTSDSGWLTDSSAVGRTQKSYSVLEDEFGPAVG
jgi:hypothetical protein